MLWEHSSGLSAVTGPSGAVTLHVSQCLSHLIPFPLRHHGILGQETHLAVLDSWIFTVSTDWSEYISDYFSYRLYMWVKHPAWYPSISRHWDHHSTYDDILLWVGDLGGSISSALPSETGDLGGNLAHTRCSCLGSSVTAVPVSQFQWLLAPHHLSICWY